MNNEPMRQLVREMPVQLMSAIGGRAPVLAPNDSIVLVGMGGSAMAAQAAALVVSDDVLTVVHRDYGLPRWAEMRRPTVIVCSYSGNTEEAIDAVETAKRRGLEVAVVTSGGVLGEFGDDVPAVHVSVQPGLPPRAALGWQTAAVIRMLSAAGAAPEFEADVEEAASVMRGLLDSGIAASLGSDLADAMVDAMPVMLGAGPVAPVAARRWATQLHENAKRIAFTAELPEMNHNLLEAMAAATDEPQSVGVVSLIDPLTHERHAVRMQHTIARLGGKVQSLGEVRAQGTSPLARFFSLVIIGDMVSVALADKLEVDAMPVAVLEDFKRAIAWREDET